MDKKTVLERLIAMSLELARPENDFVILGEGNTSARIDEETFFVKASGTYLCNAGPETFCEVRTAKVLDMLDCGELSDDDLKDRLNAAVVGNSKLRPSVETVLHAFCLSLPGVNFIGHTHPTAVNIILCCKNAEDILSGRLFPEEVVYCGARPIYIPYIDPGVPLARELRSRILKFVEEEGRPPKAIFMQNHGFIALGKAPHDVEAITAMAVKKARVLAGAAMLGGACFLSEETVRRIDTRPDEEYRREVMEKLGRVEK